MTPGAFVVGTDRPQASPKRVVAEFSDRQAVSDCSIQRSFHTAVIGLAQIKLIFKPLLLP
jgi:hypothetical protein